MKIKVSGEFSILLLVNLFRLWSEILSKKGCDGELKQASMNYSA